MRTLTVERARVHEEFGKISLGEPLEPVEEPEIEAMPHQTCLLQEMVRQQL